MCAGPTWRPAPGPTWELLILGIGILSHSPPGPVLDSQMADARRPLEAQASAAASPLLTSSCVLGAWNLRRLCSWAGRTPSVSLMHPLDWDAAGVSSTSPGRSVRSTQDARWGVRA